MTTKGKAKLHGNLGNRSMFQDRKRPNFMSLLKERRPDLLKRVQNPSPKMRLALNIFELREKQGLSQIQLAKKSGIGPTTFQRIEECQPMCNPTLKNITKIAKALGVDVLQLFRKGKF